MDNRDKPSHQKPSKASRLVGLVAVLFGVALVVGVLLIRYVSRGPLVFPSTHSTYTVPAYSFVLALLASVYGQLINACYQHYVRACFTAEMVKDEAEDGGLALSSWKRGIASFSFGGMWKGGWGARGRWAAVAAVAGLGSGALGACYSLQQSSRTIDITVFALDFPDLMKAAVATGVSFAPGGPIFPNDRTHNVGDLTAALYRLAANTSTTTIQSGSTTVLTSGIMPMPLGYNTIIRGQNLTEAPPVNISHNSYGAKSTVTCATGSTTLVQVTPITGSFLNLYYTTSPVCGPTTSAYHADYSFVDSRVCGGPNSTSQTVEIVRFNGSAQTLTSSTICNITSATVPIVATYFFNSTLSAISTRGNETALSPNASWAVGTVLADWLNITSGGSGNPGWGSLGLVTPTLQGYDQTALESILETLANLAVSKTLAQANNALNGIGVARPLDLGSGISNLRTTARLSIPVLAVGFSATNKKEVALVSALVLSTLVAGFWFLGIMTWGKSREFDPTSVVDVFKVFDDSRDGNDGGRMMVKDPLRMRGQGQDSGFELVRCGGRGRAGSTHTAETKLGVYLPLMDRNV